MNRPKRGEIMAKGLGNLVKQAQKITADMARVQEELAGKTVEASAGGGMVTVVVNGQQEIVSIQVEPEVVNKDDVEMLQDLVLAAANEALRKARDMAAEEMAKVTRGLPIAGLKIPGLNLPGLT
jgi:DNA-binding YbaB/EbfC family protein